MAGIKISDLPSSSSLTGDSNVIVSINNETYKTTINSLLSYYQAPVKSLSAESYTLLTSDNTYYIRLADVSYTPIIVISPNSIASWPIGFTTTIRDIVGNGFILSAAPGVTLNSVTSAGAAFQAMQLINVDSNVWDVL
jgi:hypothetical protein